MAGGIHWLVDASEGCMCTLCTWSLWLNELYHLVMAAQLWVNSAPFEALDVNGNSVVFKLQFLLSSYSAHRWVSSPC